MLRFDNGKKVEIVPLRGELGEYLKSKRLETGTFQSEIAVRMGRSQQAISRMESRLSYWESVEALQDYLNACGFNCYLIVQEEA